jgi:hypothetical protein
MSWDTTDHYYSGQGVVLLAQRDTAGNPKGFTPVGNVSDLKLSVAVSTLEHKESKTGQRATDLRLTTETKCSLSMTVENFIAANLADALRGTSTTVAAGTASSETLKFYTGKITALAKAKVSTVSVATTDVVPVTLTAYVDDVTDWDYRVNPEAGSILINPNTATWDGLTTIGTGGIDLQVTYDSAAQFRVDALTEGAKELYMRFEGLNTADGNSPVVVEVFKFLVDPLKELALISDSVQQFVLEGSVLADATKVTGSKFFKTIKLN